jgi:hypothetical protein
VYTTCSSSSITVARQRVSHAQQAPASEHSHPHQRATYVQNLQQLLQGEAAGTQAASGSIIARQWFPCLNSKHLLVNQDRVQLLSQLCADGCSQGDIWFIPA